MPDGTLAAVTAGAPEVSVVVATHDRPELLRALIAALRRQTLARDRFEVVLVDDSSGPATRAVIEEAGELELQLVTTDANIGAPRARNLGWRAARGALIAFTDDDCAPSEAWLEAGLRAWEGRPDRFVQGATRPAGGVSILELDPFKQSIEVTSLSPESETCNIFYPRELLERLGGFDESIRVGEDLELGWAARRAGAQPVFEPAALVEHAVVEVDAITSLRRVWRWDDVVRPFARYPELRRERLMRGVFWNWSHWLIVRALAGLPFLRSRLGLPVALWLAWPLLVYEVRNARRSGRPELAPFWLLRDLVEMAAIVRGAIRYRAPML